MEITFFLVERAVNCVNAGREWVLRDGIWKNVKNPTRIFAVLQHWQGSELGIWQTTLSLCLLCVSASTLPHNRKPFSIPFLTFAIYQIPNKRVLKPFHKKCFFYKDNSLNISSNMLILLDIFSLFYFQKIMFSIPPQNRNQDVEVLVVCVLFFFFTFFFLSLLLNPSYLHFFFFFHRQRKGRPRKKSLHS